MRSCYRTLLDDEEDAPKRFPTALQTRRTRTIQEMVIPSSCSPRWRRERRVPWLTLSGRWLEHAGFTPGVQASIEVSRGRLTITMSREHAA